MQYDPIKSRLGIVFGKSPFLRKLFYSLLDVLLLRSWHVRKLIRRNSNQLPATAEILDAGSGFGQYTWRLASMNKQWIINAVDLKEEQVTDCNKFFAGAGLATRVRFNTGDLTQLKTKSLYDLILSVDVMEHIEDDTLVFRNFYTALKPGGMLVISTPSDKGGSDVHEHDDKSFIDEHVRDGYNREAITETLKKAGFSEVSAQYTYGIPGSAAWRLSMKYPVKMLNLSGMFWAVLPFYYIVVMPFVMVLNLLDLYINHRTGTGLIVKAIK